MLGMAEKWTPERRRQRTRDALLDAALTVFARRGFHGASLDEIAETAGYTRGAIYKHFADKEELLLAACERLNDRVIADFAAIPNADVPLDKYGKADVEVVAEQWRHMPLEPDFVAVMLEFQLYALRNPEVRERAAAFRKANMQRIADYIRDVGARTGEQLPISADDMAAVFGITSDAFSQLRLVDEKNAGRLYELCLGILVRGLQAMTADDSSTSSD
jgi:AcrR family transcriptional regulator